MKISELINDLNIAFGKHGNLDIYVDIQKQETCSECGEPKSHTIDGFSHGTCIGSVDGKLCFWLLANYDE